MALPLARRSPFGSAFLRQIPTGTALALLIAVLAFAPTSVRAQTYDLVISGGRVMDPESGLDGMRDVGIAGGRIAAISARPLRGREVIRATGMVVAPGFIDLHSHADDPFSNEYQVHDGATTVLELELGVSPVERWYAERVGKMFTNYGASVSHTRAHGAPFVTSPAVANVVDPFEEGLLTREDAEKIANTTLNKQQTQGMISALQSGLNQGALGIGMAIQYLPGVDQEEVFRTFQVAAKNHVALFIHQRNAGHLHPDSIDSVQELIADAAATGAGVHICHIGSSGLNQVPFLLELIAAAHRHGIDVTTEVYPYSGAMSVYASPLLRGSWRERFGIDYHDLQSVATGERLTKETFESGRKQTPEATIVVHLIPEEMVDRAVADPSVIISSDAVQLGPGRGHPRTAGTFSRVLGRYVRERHALSLMEALAKMTIMPARRLQTAVPQMALKGRIKLGADADITIFDPERIIDTATYQKPMQFATGVVDVVVGGVLVIRNTQTVKQTSPGRPVRRHADA